MRLYSSINGLPWVPSKHRADYSAGESLRRPSSGGVDWRLLQWTAWFTLLTSCHHTATTHAGFLRACKDQNALKLLYVLPSAVCGNMQTQAHCSPAVQADAEYGTVQTEVDGVRCSTDGGRRSTVQYSTDGGIQSTVQYRRRYTEHSTVQTEVYGVQYSTDGGVRSTVQYRQR